MFVEVVVVQQVGGDKLFTALFAGAKLSHRIEVVLLDVEQDTQLVLPYNLQKGNSMGHTSNENIA